ncbi:heavy metal-associated isoprenylated plant protein 36-like [Mangifera indica]|uniref:heavy metal-associated isoprenylated plant protein 36-like n=1 Tax=Mangifera indica TaxID=29780 RepID=UPI001CF95DAE|nr:heavy metal-associated isoprenylated plant protein 36-like [Mangifera indica]
MAASEAKTEAKAEAKEKEVEETQEHLKYKTWVLRVSIHCEGCRKKLKKILTNIDGVYTTNIDLRQQKVTVVGDVDAATLIRKLEKKYGKHVELWPEQKENKKDKSKNKEKNHQQEPQNDQESSKENNSAEKETVKVVEGQGQGSAKQNDSNGGKNNNGEGATGTGTGKSSGQGNEVKNEVKQAVMLPVGGRSPVAERKVDGESEGGPEKSGGSGGGGGSDGKKKKKKGHKGNNNNNNDAGEGEPSSEAPAGSGSPHHGPHGPSAQSPIPSSANYSLPRQHVDQFRPPYYGPPPVYAASYNTTYPSTSYGTSYYATAPTTTYTYAYVHSGVASEPAPSDFDSYPPQPSGTFEMFSDENPNACSIM